MTAGKAMAQTGHAAQLGWRASSPVAQQAWYSAGFPLSVRVADASRWAGLKGSGLPVVRDAGFTEVDPGTRTAVADLPWLRQDGAAGTTGRLG